MEKRGKGEKELYEKRREKKYEFKNLILKILAMNMDRGINDELKKRAEAEGKKGRERGGKKEEEEEKEEKEGGGGTGGLIKYLKKIKEWGELKVFRVVKEAW